MPKLLITLFAAAVLSTGCGFVTDQEVKTGITNCEPHGGMKFISAGSPATAVCKDGTRIDPARPPELST